MGRRDATDRPLIVVDASALVAIAELEPDAPDLLQAIADTESAVISPVNATEAGIVLLSRGRFQSPEGFRNWRSTIAVDLSLERERAEELVAANRLYRQTATATGDAAMAQLLDELERLLVELAASPDQVSSEDFEGVQQRVAARDLLFKVRVVSAALRARQQPAAARIQRMSRIADAVPIHAS